MTTTVIYFFSILGFFLTCIQCIYGEGILNWRPNRLKYPRDRPLHHQKQGSHGMHQEHGHNTHREEISVDIVPQTKHFHVEDDFISVALDSSLFNPSRREFNFSSVRMRTLLHGLSPTTLRLGGSAADWLIFDRDANRLNAARLKPEAFVITKKDIDMLVNLTLDTGARFLMDLNIQLRYGQQWSPVNAIELFNYCVEKGYGANLDWELGNESGGVVVDEILLPPKLIAFDFVSLRKLLNTYSCFRSSRLVGPDVVRVTKSQGQQVLSEFANTAGPSVDAMTFHHYYFRGDTADWQTYIDPSHFSNLEQTIGIVRAIVANSSSPQLPIWIGETSDSWHSGTVNVSDRFISGFLWMDKLGMSAQKGISVVIRQAFFGPNYGLLDHEMQPNPDYWLSYMHKRLVGNKVLLPNTTQETPPYIRVYAQCTAASANYTRDAITFFALNVNRTNAKVLHFGASLGPTVDIYLMEPSGPDGLLSKYVALNGVRLQLINDSTFPALVPKRQQTMKGVELQPLTFAFMVFPDVQTDICSK